MSVLSGAVMEGYLLKAGSIPVKQKHFTKMPRDKLFFLQQTNSCLFNPKRPGGGGYYSPPPPTL